MNRYKINFIYSDKNMIDDIFIKVLERQLQSYMRKLCDEKRKELFGSSLSCNKEDK